MASAVGASRGSSAAGGSSSSASASGASAPEYWLLKLPNFLYEQLEAARLQQETRARSATPTGGMGGGGGAGAAQQQQPVAELWIRRLKPQEPRHTVRQTKLVLPQSGPQPMHMAPAPPLEFPLVPKPHQTMLVFGQEAQTLVPAQPASADGSQRALEAQSAFKLSALVGMAADVLPSREDARFQQAQRNRLAVEQAKQHSVMALKDANPADLKSATALVPLKRKEAPWSTARVAKVEKRVRMDAADLEAAVLDFFSQPGQTYATMTRVAAVLNQPSDAVASVVRRLCERLEDGPNKGLYGLKPEYRLAAEPAAAAHGAGGADEGAEGVGTASAIAANHHSVAANNARTTPMQPIKREY